MNLDFSKDIIVFFIFVAMIIIVTVFIIFTVAKHIQLPY